MRESFVFYNSYYEAIAEFDEIIQVHLFKAVCEYALYGTIPELSGAEKAIFTLIKPTIDANERRCNNGKKGGRPKKTDGCENEKPTVINSETNGYENEKPNVNDNVNDNENDNVNSNADEISLSGKPDRANPDYSEDYQEIISYLNQKAGTNYKSSSKKTKQFINARLAEGYKAEDFFAVIDKKCAEWLDTDMEKFLRPETLFGNKFEGYLNQRIMKGSEKNGDEQAKNNRILDAAFSDDEFF